MYGKYLRKTMKDIEASSDGRLRFVTHAGGSAGDEPEIAAKLLSGELDAAGVTTNAIEKLEPQMMVLMLPFLFESQEEYEFVRARLEPYFRERLLQQGVMMLTLMNRGGSVRIASTQAPKSVARVFAEEPFWAWRGTKFAFLFLRSMGVNAIVPLSLEEMPEALHTGRVTALRTATSDVVIFGWFPYVKTFYMLDIEYPFAAVLVSQRIWEKLPRDLRTLVRDGFEQLRPIFNKQILVDEEIAAIGMLKRGVKFVHPTPADREWLLSKKEKIWEAYQREFFPKSLLERVLEIRSEYRRTQGK